MVIFNDLRCISSDCGGVTYEPKTKNYTLRKGTKLMNSPSHEITYIKHAASTSSKTTGGKQALNKGLSY